MIYIIDANNLAGKLKMLGEEIFDKKLIERIREYNKREQRQYIIVFDGIDPMGDKIIIDEYITVIYSPKDKYYKNADDKIVEMVRRDLQASPEFNSCTVITDDVGLMKRIEKVNEERRQEVKIIRVASFAVKLIKKKEKGEKSEEDDGRRGLSDEEVGDINRELLKGWQ